MAFDKLKLKRKVFHGLNSVNKHIKTAVKYADVVNNLTEAKTLRNQFFVGTKIVDLASAHLRDRIGSSIKGDVYTMINFCGGAIQRETNQLLIDYAEKIVLPVQEGDEDNVNRTWVYSTIEGVKFSFDKALKRETYVIKGSTEGKAREIIANRMWQEYGSPIEVKVGYEAKDGGHVKSLPPQKIFYSKRSQALSEMVKSYLDKGLNRSLLLYGSPGTGKSNIALALCGKLFKRVLYFHTSTSVHGPLVKDVINDLKPEAVILNEVDKYSFSGSYLETLEFIGRNCQLFVGTSNEICLSSAIIRPGRFDDLIQIEGCDDDILENVLKFSPAPEIKEELKKWGVAYVAELAKRVEVEGGDFDVHLKKMRERLELNKPKEAKEQG